MLNASDLLITVYSAFYEAKETGVYIFESESNGIVQMLIDDQVVINDKQAQPDQVMALTIYTSLRMYYLPHPAPPPLAQEKNDPTLS